MLPPGSTIGILGGGQLGRMLAVAAAQLGYHVHIYAPDHESVAAQVAAKHVQAAWDDEPRLAAFAAACDVVTYEFENVPVDTVRFLSGHVAVRPGVEGLEIAQDRLTEKTFVAGLGGRPAPFAAVRPPSPATKFFSVRRSCAISSPSTPGRTATWPERKRTVSTGTFSNS